MRIKCPNSDVFLDLPDDRTDMKFTCPSCGKVHRVTVAVSSPGDSPTRPIEKGNLQLPKKYATGAYPPVVDVPIDADFIMLAEGGEPPLPAPEKPVPEPAAKPDRADLPKIRVSYSPRRAETPSPVPPEHESGSEEEADSAAEDSQGELDESSDFPDIPAEDGDSADFVPETPGPAALPSLLDGKEPPGGEKTSESASAPNAAARRRRPIQRRRRRTSKVLKYALLILVLAVTGYLGQQQYEEMRLGGDATARLLSADGAYQAGDIRKAASLARQAGESLNRIRTLNSPTNLWSSPAIGLPIVSYTDYHPIRAGISVHLARGRALEDFVRKLGDASNDQLRSVSEEAAAAAEADGDRTLAAVMRAEAEAAVLVRAEQAGAAELPPETVMAELSALQSRFAETLTPGGLDRLSEMIGEAERQQTARLEQEGTLFLSELAQNAGTLGADASFERIDAFRGRLAVLPKTMSEILANRFAIFGNDNFDQVELILREDAGVADGDVPVLTQLFRLKILRESALSAARRALSANEPDKHVPPDLSKRAGELAGPHPDISAETVRLIDDAASEGDRLIRLRDEVYGRLQAELRQGRINPGTGFAWSVVLMARGDGGMELDPSAFSYDADKAEAEFTLDGLPMKARMEGEDFERRLRASASGYEFQSGWIRPLRKPFSWMAKIAAGMRGAGVDPEEFPLWTVAEGPGGVIAVTTGGIASGTALAAPAGGKRRVFFDGRLMEAEELPQAAGAAETMETFRAAAKRLHEAVMADESISMPIRRALQPVLAGTYGPLDPRDYLDSDFCRRLIEANYLETFAGELSPAVREELAGYRAAVAGLDAGRDEFSVVLDDGRRMVAVTRLGDGSSETTGEGDQAPDGGESLPAFTWRIESQGQTVFFSPLPARTFYSLSLAEHYRGVHRVPPADSQPILVEVHHALRGRVASYRPGAERAEGRAEDWNAACRLDRMGWNDPVSGPPGWDFPFHVLQRDDQGDPVAIATIAGVVKTPDFSDIPNENSRRAAEDAWFDSTAGTLSAPGELGLLFHHFSRYCSDSPLPELPALIGSHFGSSDTHQTVRETLRRRWLGRLIGDCDDLAEFFQVLTSRQGKLSHVMRVPSHAACGYVEDAPGGEKRFVVLQTGPVLQFTAPTMNEAIEDAYRYFDREGGESAFTVDAVPLLLRFAGEDTRTPFVLSSRIYGDKDYAEAMIQVQSYWHEHVYSAAIREMEAMIDTDREIGNIKELASLYERVGRYEKSAELRREELRAVAGDPQARLSTLLDIAQLHRQAKDGERALQALGEAESLMKEFIRNNNSADFFRAMPFRSYWSLLLGMLGEPARGWELVRYDVDATKRQLGYPAEPVVRTMVSIYDRLRRKQDDPNPGPRPRDGSAALTAIERELANAFSRGFFKEDDSYNDSIMRYTLMGKYAVAKLGRSAGVAKLLGDGPYPGGPRDHASRGVEITEDDWRWFRIAPRLYLLLALEMLDKEENPDLYDPPGAKPLLEAVSRAVRNGTGLGSEVAGEDARISAGIILAFLNRDVEGFGKILAEVRDKNYSRLYDEAALDLGFHCGLIPLPEFDAWIRVFRDNFPGKQHYFKVVYRAIDEGHYDHALAMAEATARFFPDEQLLVEEAEFIKRLVPELKLRTGNSSLPDAEARPAA